MSVLIEIVKEDAVGVLQRERVEWPCVPRVGGLLLLSERACKVLEVGYRPASRTVARAGVEFRESFALPVIYITTARPPPEWLCP